MCNREAGAGYRRGIALPGQKYLAMYKFKLRKKMVHVCHSHAQYTIIAMSQMAV